MTYSIIEEPKRISAVDHTGAEIVGAQMPHDDVVWKLYATDRLTDQMHNCHPILCSRNAARQWVVIIASLYVRAVHQESAA